MRSITETVTIESRPEHVFELVADLEQLPRWAIGFAKQIRRENGGWRVELASGDELAIRVEADAARGTVDYFMSPEPDVELPAATRVVANGEGTEYVFTMFQAPGTPDEVFEQQAAELRRELTVLKATVESSCPL